MALFKKFLSAVKKFFRGKSSSWRKKRKLTSARQRKKGRRERSVKKKNKKITKKKLPKIKKHPSQKSFPVLPVKKAAPPAGVLTGEVTHYFSKIAVVVVKMTKGSLAVGNCIHIRGKSTNFIQKVDSLQIESQDVKIAPKGQLVGLKVVRPAKPGDKVFKLLS